jgi:hypothetical protein
MLENQDKTFIAIDQYLERESIPNKIKIAEEERVKKIISQKNQEWRKIQFDITKEDKYLKKLKQKVNFKTVIGSHIDLAQNFVICLDLINSLEDAEDTRQIKEFFNIPEIDQLTSDVRKYNVAINKRPYLHRITEAVDRWKTILWLPLEKFKLKLHYDKEAFF